MPITFACQECHKDIRVPEGTQGRRTQCPFCQAVQTIPGEKPSTDPAAEPTSGSAGSSFGDVPGPMGPDRRSIEGSPFSSQQRQEDAENPFASPTSRQTARAPSNVTLGELRQQLLIPSIVQLVFVVLGLLYALFQVGMMTFIALDANEPGMFIAVAMYGGSAVLHLPAIFGLVAAIRQSSITWAWVGFVLSVVPFSNCCSCAGVPIGIGIWGMIVLANPATRRLFPE